MDILLRVSRHDKKPHSQSPPPQQPPTKVEISKLVFAPVIEQADQPPLLANQVQVEGGADTVTLTFHYVSHSTMLRAFQHANAEDTTMDGSNIEIQGDTLTVRTEPIARIALPLTVVADMMAEVLDTVIGGMPDVQQSLKAFGARMSEIIMRATPPQERVVQESSEDGTK